MTKVFMICIDGASFDKIGQLVKKGRLPNIKRLMENGVSGSLRSTSPPETCPAFISMFTGKEPSKLGIYSFLQFERERRLLRYNGSMSYRGDTLHKILTKYRKKVCMLLVPLTYPATPVDGVMISGWPVSGNLRKAFWPESEYPLIMQNYDLTHLIDIPYSYHKSVIQNISYTTNFFLDMATRRDYDFIAVTYRHIDVVNHLGEPDTLDLVYEHIDAEIGRLVRAVGEDKIVCITSDHGSGPCHLTFRPNVWLRKMNLLKVRENRLEYFMHFAYVKIKPLIKFLTNYLPFLLDKIYSKEHLFQTFNRLEWEVDLDAVDWKKTKAICWPTGEAILISLNREILDEEGSSLVVKTIINGLRQINFPGKGKLSILQRLQIYPKGDERSPDIYARIDGVDISASFYGGIFTRPEKYGNHRCDGIFIMSGPGIEKGLELREVSILDVAPTILASMGLPVPSDVDGRVLGEIFSMQLGVKLEEATYNEKSHTFRFGEEDEREIYKRLKSLGYL